MNTQSNIINIVPQNAINLRISNLAPSQGVDKDLLISVRMVFSNNTEQNLYFHKAFQNATGEPYNETITINQNGLLVGVNVSTQSANFGETRIKGTVVSNSVDLFPYYELFSSFVSVSRDCFYQQGIGSFDVPLVDGYLSTSNVDSQSLADTNTIYTVSQYELIKPISILTAISTDANPGLRSFNLKVWNQLTSTALFNVATDKQIDASSTIAFYASPNNTQSVNSPIAGQVEYLQFPENLYLQYPMRLILSTTGKQAGDMFLSIFSFQRYLKG